MTETLGVGQQFDAALELHQGGRFAEAKALYEEILRREPRHADATHLLGLLAAQNGDPQQAIELIGRAVELEPDNAVALCNRGSVLKDLGRLEAALADFDRAVALEPRFAGAHFIRAVVLQSLNRSADALASLDHAIALEPGNAEAHYLQGNLHIALTEPARAIASYDRAIAVRPEYAEAYCHRGNAHDSLGRPVEALADYERAIALQPDYAAAHSNRGVLLHKLGRAEEAVASCTTAIALRHDYADAFFNRAIAHKDCRRFAAAIADCDAAIALRPDYAEAHFLRATTQLLSGDFANGWANYEWRWRNRGFGDFQPTRRFVQPLWLGDAPLAGKTILLHGEQGLGDTIQFCRYARLAAERGATVLLEVQPRLAPLLASLAGVSRLFTRGDALPDFDYHTPLMSLPLAFRTRLDSVPAAPRYLHADPGKVAEWQARLGAGRRPRVGLTWSGRESNPNDHNRSLKLADLLSGLPGAFEYVSLQREVRPGDLATLRNAVNLRHFGEQQRDFGDAAALVSCMDLVISVDTSAAHLSAALGRPTWILLSDRADWRWLDGRDDSPWYPTVRLWRQRGADEWPGLLARVRAELSRVPLKSCHIPVT